MAKNKGNVGRKCVVTVDGYRVGGVVQSKPDKDGKVVVLVTTADGVKTVTVHTSAVIF